MTVFQRFAGLLFLCGCALFGCTGEPAPNKSVPKVSAMPAGAAKDLQPTQAEKPPTIQDCTFDDIKFDMVKGDPFERTMLTAKIEALAGQWIRIRGYILPSFQQRGLTQFVLVRDNQECCFGPGAALYDCILVSMQPGKSTDFSIRPVAVEGVFTIDEVLGPDGNHLAIYHLSAVAVN